MHLSILLWFFSCNKDACTHLDNTAQSAYLNGEFLSLHRKYAPFLCKTFNINNITVLNVAGTDCFSMRHIPLHMLGDIRLVQSVSCLLYRLTAFFHSMIIKLLFEGFDRFFRIAPCLTNDVVRLFACLVQEFLSRIGKYFAFSVQTSLHGFYLCLFVAQFAVFALVILLFPFEFVDDMFKMRVFLTDIDFCTRDNILRQTKLTADGKGVARPGNPDQKPIGRAQCLEIELDRGIFNPHLCIGIGF